MLRRATGSCRDWCLFLLLLRGRLLRLLRSAGAWPVLCVVDRMALLVEIEAEVLGEALDRRLDRPLGLLAPIPAGDLLQQLRLVGAHRLGQVGEEPGDP